MSEILLGVNTSLQCNVQALGLDDCSSPLVSDGGYWVCPYGHIQGFDGKDNPIRKILDRRTSVRQQKRLV